VADNIEYFGGYPCRVTIPGGSAGSILVFDQMILFNGSAIYKGKPLFHGATMDSGSVTPVEPNDSPRAQEINKAVVKAA
jgi:triacylglycerol lipase